MELEYFSEEGEDRLKRRKSECEAYHLNIQNRGLNKAVRSVGFEQIVFLSITGVRNTDFSCGIRLKNLLGLNIFNTALNDMTLPESLQSFTAIDCPYVMFENALPNLELLHLENNGYVNKTRLLENSPLSSVVLRTKLLVDTRFIETVNFLAQPPGLKYLTLSQNYSETHGYFLAFWYHLEYLHLGDHSIHLRHNELQSATFNLAAKESKTGKPDLARVPKFTIGDLMFELESLKVS